MPLARSTPIVPRLTGMTLDRASALRSDPSWVEHQLALPGARAVAASDQGVLLDPAGQALRRVAMPRESAEPILLGLEDGEPLFAVDLESTEISGSVVSLREAGSTLQQSEGGLAAYAVALLNWHRRHRFCANCGTATEVAEGGYSRHCPNCGALHFPRTDPVVIMLVEHDGHLLLGRRAGWPGRRFSVLAGFVSPGESAEEAVVREVREESGIVAYDPRFVASQPWPFPASLMLGFNARSDGGRPVARDGELAEVEWFTREQVRAAASGDSGRMALPPPVSIARFLIDRWLGGEGIRG
jgi:NAD+ diphosphatase